METKYFQSRYNEIHKTDWEKIIKALGVNTYDVIVPCELAVIFGGYFENPSAFKGMKTLVFYKTDFEDDGSVAYKNDRKVWDMFEKRKYEVWTGMLKAYFDKTVDLTGLNPKEAADKIRGEVKSYQ